MSSTNILGTIKVVLTPLLDLLPLRRFDGRRAWVMGSQKPLNAALNITFTEE